MRLVNNNSQPNLSAMGEKFTVVVGSENPKASARKTSVRRSEWARYHIIMALLLFSREKGLSTLRLRLTEMNGN